MQWTDESGRAYGEDPYDGVAYPYAHGYDGVAYPYAHGYDGVAYPYAHGYDHSGSATADTATMPWGQVQLAQWTHPSGDTRAPGTGPYATGMHSYAVGRDPHTATSWGAPRADALTVPPPEPDTTVHPVPDPDVSESDSVRHVFVDSSGRRQRRVLRAARLLVIPAGGYVALLISTVLGGPSLSSPFVPQPGSTHPTTPHAAAPDSSPHPGHSAGSATPTAAQKTSHPTRTTASATAAAPVPAVAPTSKTSPAPTRTAPTPRGRALGSSHKPLK
ncbi:hypothetical protein [Streptomyces hygroscopicus]|uniref:hypothetical protein n=1 Tax=Streptomyces hygroscopicus TaxID=1912 RepID=UPI00223ECC4D|nr:hypothetical protein [Streptomyces hygroscopicus]